MPLFELIALLRRYRERGQRQPFTQKELLKRELQVIVIAVSPIGVFVGIVFLIASNRR